MAIDLPKITIAPNTIYVIIKKLLVFKLSLPVSPPLISMPSIKTRLVPTATRENKLKEIKALDSITDKIKAS